MRDVDLQLLSASCHGDQTAVRRALAVGADVNSVNQDGATPLYIAAERGHDTIVQKLLAAGAIIDLATTTGATPLYIAAEQGHDTIVDKLLAAGAHIDHGIKSGPTPLHIAAYFGHGRIVKKLLAAGARVDVQTDEGGTPLIIAAQSGHDSIVEMLLVAGANINFTTNLGATPLLAGARNGHKGIVDKLLKAGATIDLATNDGFTPLCVAAEEGHDNIVERLLMAGANINWTTNVGATPLCVAAFNGHTTTIKKLLVAGADINLATYHGNTPLSTAAGSGRTNIVQTLLELGAIVDVVDSDGDSALLCAAIKGHADVTRILVRAGADTSIRNKEGKTAADFFEMSGQTALARQLREHKPSPRVFFRAVERGNLDVVRRLASVPSLASARGKHARTPLHLAATLGQTQIIQILLRNGAKIDARDDNGTTPLHIACGEGNITVMCTLLEHGANPSTCDDQGLSCVGISAMNGHLDAVKLLMKRGVSLSNRASDGRTILHLGVLGQCESVIELLLKEGAVDVNALDDQGWTPLHYAADTARCSIAMKEADRSIRQPIRVPDAPYLAGLRLLLSTDGINVDAQDLQGRSALLIATEHGDLNAIRLLLDHGARVDVADKISRTPLSVTADTNIKTVLQLFHNRQQYHDRCLQLLNNRDSQPSPDQISDLVPLITSVYDLRLLFTLASQFSDPSSRSVVLKSAFSHVITNKLTYDDDACVFFKIVLNRCARDGVVSQADSILFDRKAEKINNENADWVVEIKRQLHIHSWRLDAQDESMRSLVDGVKHVHAMVLENRAAVVATAGRIEELQSQVVVGRQLMGKLMTHAKYTSAQVAHLQKRLRQTDENIQHVAKHLTNFRDAYLNRLEQEEKNKRTKMICGAVASVAGFIFAPVLKEISDAVVDLTNPIDIVSTIYGEQDIAAFLADQSEKALSDVAKDQLEKYAIPQDEFETLLREEIALMHPEIVAECKTRGLVLQVDGGRSEVVKSLLTRSLEAEESVVIELLQDIRTALHEGSSQIHDMEPQVHIVGDAIQQDLMVSLDLAGLSVESAVTSQSNASTIVLDVVQAGPVAEVVENTSKTPPTNPENEAQATTDSTIAIDDCSGPFHTAITDSRGDLSLFKQLISAIRSHDADATAPVTMQLRRTLTTRENLCAAEYAYARGFSAVGDILAALMPNPPPSINTSKAVSVELVQPIDAFAFVCVVDESHGDADECAELCELVDEDEHALDATIEANVIREGLETVMWTPVEYACHLGYVDLVKFMLKDANKKMPTRQKIELLKRARDRAAGTVGAAA